MAFMLLKLPDMIYTGAGPYRRVRSVAFSLLKRANFGRLCNLSDNLWVSIRTFTSSKVLRLSFRTAHNLSH